jgi:hypothetical protein
VNLLTFKPTADAPDEGMSGEEAYRRYADHMRAFVESKGGRFPWIGRVEFPGDRHRRRRLPHDRPRRVPVAAGVPRDREISEGPKDFRTFRLDL